MRPTINRLSVAVFGLFVLALIAASCSEAERPTLLEPPGASEEVLPSSTVEQPTAPVGDTVPVPDATGIPAPGDLVRDEPDEVAGVVEEPVDAPDCLSERQWIGQTLMPLAPQSELELVRPLAEAGLVNGLTILGFPDAGVGATLAELDAAGPLPLLFASDEEGGIVQRLGEVLGTTLPSAQSLSAMPAADVRQLFAGYGQQMKALGFDIALAPVVDIGGGPGIGNRSFGSDPAVVTEYAAAVADGYADAGILPVFKHFPGHGRASADSHILLPVTPPFADMAAVDLVPYETLLARPDAAVMVAHLSVPGLSDETPTTLSPNTVMRLLRGTGGETFEGRSFNFDGLVFSDALNMGAIVNGYGTQDAAVRSLSVGIDVLILGGPNDVEPVIDAVLAALADDILSWAQIDDSVGRVLAQRGVARTRCRS